MLTCLSNKEYEVTKPLSICAITYIADITILKMNWMLLNTCFNIIILIIINS